MNTIMKNAGNALDALAKKYQQEKNVSDYGAAFKAVAKEHPHLYRAYDRGQVVLDEETKTYQELTVLEQTMLRAQNDSSWVRRLAGGVLDHYARMVATHSGRPEMTYAIALRQVMRDNPKLARAADDGYLTDDDWGLLGIIVPSVAGEVEKVHGVKSQVVATFADRRPSAFAYHKAHVYHDNNGNEVRRYVL